MTGPRPAAMGSRRAATAPPRAMTGLRRALSALAMALAAAVGLLPGPVAAQGAGSGATTVLRIAPGPRPLALANAFSAVPDPAAVEYNPAAVTGPGEVVAGWQALPVGASAGSALAVVPAGRVTLAASLRFVDYGDVAVVETSGDGLPVGTPTGDRVGGGEVSALAGGSLRLGPLRVGVAGRWLRLQVAGLSDDAVSVDAGVLLEPRSGVRVAASVQHLGATMDAGRSAPLPRTGRVGASLDGELGGLSVLLTGEARWREDRTGGGVGLEVGRRWPGEDGEGGAAVLRLGYEPRAADGDAYAPLVVGGGIRLGPLGVDLAWRSLGPLGATRQVGVRYRF